MEGGKGMGSNGSAVGLEVQRKQTRDGILPETQERRTGASLIRSKKKKWSKGKVKDKANNAVVLDKAIYDRIMKEVPTYKVITTSTLVDRMKVNGSLARKAIQHLEKEGLIKPVVHSSAQLVYTRATAGKE